MNESTFAETDLAVIEVIELPDPPDLPAEVAPAPARRSFLSLLGAAARAVGSAFEWLIGGAALVFGLAFLAAMPVLQLLSLGYFLECTGRIGRTGRLRDGLIGFRKAARVGAIAVGCWLTVLPVRLAASLASSAEIIDPGGPIARMWRVGLISLAAFAGLHVVLACARGGKLRYFLWPFGHPFWLARRLREGNLYRGPRDAVWEFVTALRLPYYFWLGLRGFVGTLAWLIVPVTLIAVGKRAPLVGFLGALLLALIVPTLPMIQAHFAAQGRFRALFEYRAVRERFRRAPWAFSLAAIATLVAAVPLYLLKIEIVPREAAWLPSLVFVLFLFPARLLAGWAYSRSARRPARRHWFFRTLGRIPVIPVALFYVLIVFLAQYTSWGGFGSLYEQHAFLVPVPFLSL